MNCDICKQEFKVADLNVVQKRYVTNNISHICDCCKATIDEYKRSLYLAPLSTEVRLTKKFMREMGIR